MSSSSSSAASAVAAAPAAPPAAPSFYATRDKVEQAFAVATPELASKLAASLSTLRAKYDALHAKFYPDVPGWVRCQRRARGARRGPVPVLRALLLRDSLTGSLPHARPTPHFAAARRVRGSCGCRHRRR